MGPFSPSPVGHSGQPTKVVGGHPYGRLSKTHTLGHGCRFKLFCPPHTPFWAHADQTRDLAASWATWLKSRFRGQLFPVTPSPLLAVCTFQNCPNEPLEPRFGALAVPAAPLWGVGLMWARNRDLAVSWATWLKSQFRGHVPQVQAPTFLWFPHIRMIPTHP